MAKSEEEIIRQQIKSYIDRKNGRYKSWYVGVSGDARRRLFYGHNVDKKDWWIFRITSSSSVARRIESYFFDTVGTDGAPGGGTEEVNAVYAYKKRAHTDP